MFRTLFDSTMVTSNWKKIENAASKQLPVLFPLGVIEEHGPHLPLGSDIYYSNAMCALVKEKLHQIGCECVIAPPYYWGINHCTGGFPGSFSLKPETMQQVLFEIFENLQNFGFSDIYCFNYHGDPLHVRTIKSAITKANKELNICVKLVLESIDLPLYGWSAQDEFLLVSSPDYPAEWFEDIPPSEHGLFDIHAGAFETAVMNYICPQQTDLALARTLKSASLTADELKKWHLGGKDTRETVPLGYAGNPAGYETASCHVEEMLALQSEDIARRICTSLSVSGEI